MRKGTQISAVISATTKQRLERYTEARGMKKAAVIEAALLHHLQALDELPLDLIVPARIVVSAESFQRMAALVREPPPPTDAMEDLMAGRRVGGLDD